MRKKLKIIIIILIVSSIFKMLYLNMDSLGSTFSKFKYNISINKISLLTEDEIKDKEKRNEKYILYIGSEDCSYCRDDIKTIKNTLKGYSSKNINNYYYPVDMEGKDFGNILNMFDLEYIPSIVYFDGQERNIINYK